MSSDGRFFNNALPPFLAADVAAVTLAVTNKALVPAAQLPVLGPNFFAFPGKKLRFEAFGRMTTVVTPGNFQMAVYWGTGADANGVLLAQTTAAALTANQISQSWFAQFDITCRSVGNAGTLFCTGRVKFAETVMAAMQLLPASAPVVSAACDLTSATLIPSLQALRSGSTVETMQVHELTVSELN